MARFFLIMAAISGFLAVVIGAFAAHGLKQLLPPVAFETVKIGVQYQMYHALVLLLVGLWMSYKPVANGFKAQGGLKAAGLAFILGTLLFSGSLYGLALGAPRWLGPVTPIGGLCFLIGWLLLAVTAWQTKPNE